MDVWATGRVGLQETPGGAPKQELAKSQDVESHLC
jgi:hypothetical protein